MADVIHMVGDFQTVDEDGRVVLSVEDVEDELFVVPTVGERVLIDDEDGHTCEAIVEILGDDLWTLVLDWASWSRSGGPSAAIARGWRPPTVPAPVSRQRVAF